jgi:hypothetical protein
MELIPILSTIILVATICTFILAVGAYILYKIREGKVQQPPVTEPANLYAEYIVPKEQQVKKVFVEDVIQPGPKKTVLEERYKQVEASEGNTVQYQNFVEEKRNEDKWERPKQKFVNVQSLESSTEQQNESSAGEIKWR